MKLPYVVMKSIGFLCLLFLAGAAGFTIAQASFLHGYTVGNNVGYKDGVRQGNFQACTRAVEWARWAANVEHDMVASGKYWSDTGYQVIQDTNAGYGMVCGVATPADIYSPASAPVATPINPTPTLPIAGNAPRLPCPLSAKACPKEGIN